MKGQLTTLIILDGYGESADQNGNAVRSAATPNLDAFIRKYPHTTIEASGRAVGLPEGQMGNSEVGHLNLGAGRVVYQELTRITKAIEDGDFFDNEVLLSGIENCRRHDSALHLMGLVSDGGVHSHITHLYAFLEAAGRAGLSKVFVHCFMDGRDTPPMSGAAYLESLEKKMAELGVGEIATVSGRYYAMDRDNRWERVKKAYDAIVLAQGETAETAAACMERNYAHGVTDEFIQPCLIAPEKEKRIQENDTVIFFNFRPDRARELTRSLIFEDFDGFRREQGYFPIQMIGMTQYDASFTNIHTMFKPELLTNTLGEYLSHRGISQLRIAETEKYAHVTYFFNGGIEKQFPGESRILVPSPKVATYDLQPEMSAFEVTEKVLEAIDSKEFGVIILNFANCDMVGHTGVMSAAEKAVETVDACVKQVTDAVIALGGNVILTADHGNAEKMIDSETGEPWTAHTTNPVVCVVAGIGDVELRSDGRLADIAPTMLDLLGEAVPAEMTGESLINKEEV